MGRYSTIYTTVDIDVDFDDLDTDDLIDELQERGYTVYEDGLPVKEDPYAEPPYSKQLLDTIYHKRRQGIPVEHDLDRLIYEVLGRII